MQGQGCHAAVPGRAGGDDLGEGVVDLAGERDGLRGIGHGLKAGSGQGQQGIADAGGVHLPQSLVGQVEQLTPDFDHSLRVFVRRKFVVELGEVEVLLEPDLVLHGILLGRILKVPSI